MKYVYDGLKSQVDALLNYIRMTGELEIDEQISLLWYIKRQAYSEIDTLKKNEWR